MEWKQWLIMVWLGIGLTACHTPNKYAVVLLQ